MLPARVSILALLMVASPLLAQSLVEARDVPFWRSRNYHAVAWDGARQRAVLFGDGRAAMFRLPSDPVWEWDGQLWSPIVPTGAQPGARYSHAMAFDPITRRVILFGGYDGFFTLFDDTWAWDGRTWTRLAPTTRPAGRWAHGLATDYARGRVVMFGGSLSAGPVSPGIDETWEWDGTDWTQIQPPVRPGFRGSHGMAYDARDQRVIVYGGWSGGWAYSDTWSWDGVTWRQHAVGDGGPGPRAGFSMATDPSTGRPLLYSGSVNSLLYYNDTWTWTGNAWEKQASQPELHGGGALAETGSGVILVGGWDGVIGSLGPVDTWAWDGVTRTWTQADAPVSKGQSTVLYHSGLDAFVGVIGEYGQTGYLSTLGRDGRYNPPLTTLPVAANYLTLGHHQGLDVVLVQNFGTATWTWDRRQWTRADSPRHLGGWSSWYDPNRRKLVFASAEARSFVEWDSSGWSERTFQGGPVSRQGALLGYDPRRDRVVLYGGYDPLTRIRLTDTWECDGGTWTQVVALSALGVRFAGSLLYSPAYEGLLTVMTDDREIWLWDGQAWTRLASDALRRSADGMPIGQPAYDPTRNRLLVAYSTQATYPPLTEVAVVPLRADQRYPRLGETVTLSVDFPREGNNTLLVGLSTALDPGIPIRTNATGLTEVFPLAPTPLLFATVQATPLDAQGRGSLRLTIPNNPQLWWLRLYAAGIVVRPGPTLGTITNSTDLWIVR